MAKCNECIHFDVCKELDDNAHIVPRDWYDTELLICEGAEKCEFFKPKSRFIELPCDIGTKVYWINNEEVRATYFEVFDVTNFGKTIFLTREEAENALKEMGK